MANMLLAKTHTIVLTESNIRDRKLKILFLNITSNGFRLRLIRQRDTLICSLILNNNLKTRLYAVFKLRIDNVLNLYHKEEQ